MAGYPLRRVVPRLVERLLRAGVEEQAGAFLDGGCLEEREKVRIAHRTPSKADAAAWAETA